MRVGKYELLIRLASGGAANVFLARDPDSARLIALKLLLPALASDEDFVTMFLTEAQIASQLAHPNIVGIADYGQRDGVQLLAMEYVFGPSLAQVLRASARAKRPLTVGVLLKLTSEVCGALHHAHEKVDTRGQPMGLVHRDITPQNVLIGFNGIPKLTDFGIAKATNRGWETQAGIVKGKFSYMSPEQAMGGRVNRRSDIFGLGIVLWEALTGKELFGGTTPLEVLNDIRNKRLLPPSQVVPGLTPIVDPIVMKALRRSPDQRFQTAQEMQLAIETLIRRAKVVLDATTIAKELVAIYGPVVQTRTAALERARRGDIDPEELAEIMGGSVLDPKLLPARSPEEAANDPHGLFAPSGVQTLDLPASGIPPARSDFEPPTPQVSATFSPPPSSSQRPLASASPAAGLAPLSPPPPSGAVSAPTTEQTDDLPRRQRRGQAPPPGPGWRNHAEPALPAGVGAQQSSEEATQIGRPQAQPAPSAEVMSFEDMERSLLQEFSEPPAPAPNPFEEETVAVAEGTLPPGAFRPEQPPPPPAAVSPSGRAPPAAPTDVTRNARTPPPPAPRPSQAASGVTEPPRTPQEPPRPSQAYASASPAPRALQEPPRPSQAYASASPAPRAPQAYASASQPQPASLSAPPARTSRTPLPAPAPEWARPSATPGYPPQPRSGPHHLPLPPGLPSTTPTPKPIPAVVVPKPPSSDSNPYRETNPRVRRLPQTDPAPVNSAHTQPTSPLHEPELPRAAVTPAPSETEHTVAAAPQSTQAPKATSASQERALHDELSAALDKEPVSVDLAPTARRDEAPTLPRAEVQRPSQRSPSRMSPVLKWVLLIPVAAALILLGVVLATLLIPS